MSLTFMQYAVTLHCHCYTNSSNCINWIYFKRSINEDFSRNK